MWTHNLLKSDQKTIRKCETETQLKSKEKKTKKISEQNHFLSQNHSGRITITNTMEKKNGEKMATTTTIAISANANKETK